MRRRTGDHCLPLKKTHNAQIFTTTIFNFRFWDDKKNTRNSKTYWPAGGGRGQNPSRTGVAQGLDLCLKYGPRELRSECYTSLGRLYVPREVDLADRLGSLRSPRLSARSTSLETYSL